MTSIAASLSSKPSHMASTPRRKLFVRHPELFTIVLIVLVSAVVGTLNPYFFQLSTLFDILRLSTVTGLFALGVLIVLAAGGIDVSFTAIATLCMYAITKAVLAYWPGAPFALILGCGALIGALLGACNGYLIHRLRAPSLIVTIGTQYFVRGFLLTFVGTVFFMVIPESMDGFGRITLIRHIAPSGSIAVLPASVLVLAVAAGATWFLLNRNLMGLAVYAMGVTGSVGGTLLGVVLVTLINNVLILAGVPSTWQKLVIGIFILLAGAVIADRRKK